MAVEWETRPVAEAPLDIIDGDRGVNYPKQGDFSSSGDCLFLNTGNVTAMGFSFNECSFITREKDAALRKGKLQRHDVVLTTRGTVGNAALFDESVLFDQMRINSGMVLLRAEQEKLWPRFLYQFVRSQLFKTQVEELTTGSAQPQLPIRDIRRLKIPIPPLAEQKLIAEILGSLDDKIELNRRMNETLEAMARALFLSWFVNFDPVRAKLDGRQPTSMAAETAALFPAAFQDSPLGPIPKGWEAGNFAKVITSFRERVDDSVAIVLSAVSRSELVRSDEHFTKQVYSKSISNYLKVRHWDFAYNPSRINIGSIGMLKEDIVGAVSPVYEVFRPINPYHWFVERALALPDTKVWIQSLCSGSVRQSLKLNDLMSIPLVIPPEKIVHAFNRSWDRANELILANQKQSHTLAALRDALLPKLLSGELRAGNVSAKEGIA